MKFSGAHHTDTTGVYRSFNSDNIECQLNQGLTSSVIACTYPGSLAGEHMTLYALICILGGWGSDLSNIEQDFFGLTRASNNQHSNSTDK